MIPMIEHQGVITNLFQTSDLNDYPSSFHHNRGLRYCLTRMIYSTLLFPSKLTDISRQVKGLSFGDLNQGCALRKVSGSPSGSQAF